MDIQFGQPQNANNYSSCNHFRANKRLADDAAQYTGEISRLRALLKKEEITRCSLQEQLNQKTKENEELIKIWDDLKSDR